MTKIKKSLTQRREGREKDEGTTEAPRTQSKKEWGVGNAEWGNSTQHSALSIYISLLCVLGASVVPLFFLLLVFLLVFLAPLREPFGFGSSF
jgi:hypothetical protein